MKIVPTNSDDDINLMVMYMSVCDNRANVHQCESIFDDVYV